MQPQPKETMTPTNRLRFVKREIKTPIPGTLVTQVRMAHILQQWWEEPGLKMNLGWSGDIPIGKQSGTWRDVPVEVE